MKRASGFWQVGASQSAPRERNPARGSLRSYRDPWAFLFYFNVGSFSFCQRRKLNTSWRFRKLAKFTLQYSQRHRFAPSRIFNPANQPPSKLSFDHVFRSIRMQLGHRAYRMSDQMSVLAVKRVLQSPQRNGRMKRSWFSCSFRFRGRDIFRKRLLHFGQATGMRVKRPVRNSSVAGCPLAGKRRTSPPVVREHGRQGPRTHLQSHARARGRAWST